MAIVYVRKLKDRPSFTIDENGAYYVERYLVKSDDVNESRIAIASAVDPNTGLGIPVVRVNVHQNDETAACRKVEGAPVGDDGLLWLVTVDYGTLENRTNQEQFLEPVPWQRKPDVECFAVPSEVAFEMDIRTNQPVMNTARMRFSPPPTREVTTAAIRFSRNQEKFNFRWLDETHGFINTVNAEQLSIAGHTFGPNEAWMKDIRAVRANERQHSFWRVSFEIWFKGKAFPASHPLPPAIENVTGWRRPFMSTGYHQIVATPEGARLEIIRDNTSEPVTEPVPLKANGTAWRPETDQDNDVGWKVYDDKRIVSWLDMRLEI